MSEIKLVGIDLAKNVFQVHAVSGSGAVQVRKKLSRAKLLSFLAQLPACTVAMEACAGAHYWGRQITLLGHQVRLIPARPLASLPSSSTWGHPTAAASP